MLSETTAWVERQRPQLVAWAEGFVLASELHQSRPMNKRSKGHRNRRKPGAKGSTKRHAGGKAKVQASQLRHLLNAAQTGSSLAVLTNFLKYQIGRGNKGWGDQRSGRQLLTLLDQQIAPLVHEGTRHLETTTGNTVEPEDRVVLEAAVTSQFFGFMIREYTYRCAIAGTKTS